MDLTRTQAALISGLKAFFISGLASVGVLLNTGVDISDPKKIGLAVLIAFIAGGLKSLEKAYNYQP